MNEARRRTVKKHRAKVDAQIAAGRQRWISITNADLDRAAREAGPAGAVVVGPLGLRIVLDASTLNREGVS